MEHLKSRGAPFAVSCALHVGLLAGLVLTQHWVSGAVVLHPPVVPVQLVAPDTPPVAPEPPRAPVKPPRLLEPPSPAEPPVARRETPPTPPFPVARREEPPPAPPPARREEPPPPVAPPAPTPPPAPAPAVTAAGDTPVPVAETAASAPTSALVSAPSASPTTGRREVSAAPSGPRTAAVAPQGITRYARPQGGYQVRPEYPATARRLGVQGTTLLRVHVLADGHVGDVLVEKSAGHPDLDEAAAEAVKRWRF